MELGLLVDTGWSLVALPVIAAAAYLFVLALLSAEPEVPPAAAKNVKFDFIVPSHNEETGIARTVEDLLKVDWPKENFRVIVVADNCSDLTAQKAREAGAMVLERNDTTKRGKGYALDYAFKHVLSEGKTDAVVVVDADTLVNPQLLAAYAARIAQGANAMQAHYAVMAPNPSWRTRLMEIAFALFHGVRSNARERLKVSCGLRGNGMCFTRRLITEVPHDAFSIVEDLEYGIRIGRQGHRVWYIHEAEVRGEMVSGEKASRSQRQRWEGGREKVRKQFGWPLLREALAKRSGLLLDLALDVLVPPLANVGLALFGGLLVAIAIAVTLGHGASVGTWAMGCFFLAVYVFRGWMISKSGVSGLFALAYAPVYAFWKVWLKIKTRSESRAKQDEWVRTTREGREPGKP